MVKKHRQSTRGPDTIRIPVDGDRDHFGASYYHAVLAYPNPADRLKRVKFIEAVTAYLCKEYIATGSRSGAVGGSDFASVLRSLQAKADEYHRRANGKRAAIPSHYRKFKREKIYTKINQGLYRISAWRLPAATMAYKMILHNPEVWRHLPPDFHPELRTPMGVNKAADEIAELLGEDLNERQHRRKKKIGYWLERSNVLSRVWSGTKAVLHLAIAYPTSPGTTTDPMALIKDPSSWLPQAVRQGEVLRSVLHHFVPSFDPSKAIRLLPSQK